MPDLVSSSGPVWAVVPAGGSGSRFSQQQDKLLAELVGRPVLIHTVQALLSAPSVDGLVLVSSDMNQAAYQTLIRQWLPDAPVHFAIGGDTRRDSVFQGLLALPGEARIVLIHDAARPLIQPEIVEASITAVRQGNSGAIVAVPIHDTVKQTASDNRTIAQTLDRSRLWRAQTPQVFDKARLLQAHQHIAPDTPVTDDAQLMELAGLGPVTVISGDERNLKITTPTDLLMAEAFLQTR
jgi:2-C-methyl-D-erythritol 4-phosphate cytidylyltransferase